MNRKVAYNSMYGGFSLSFRCMNWLADRGHPIAIEAIGYTPFKGLNDFDWPGHRHDPLLVLAIESLGSEVCSTDVSSIQLYELIGDRYIIRDYDGLETVLEPNSIEWVSVT